MRTFQKKHALLMLILVVGLSIGYQLYAERVIAHRSPTIRVPRSTTTTVDTTTSTVSVSTSTSFAPPARSKTNDCTVQGALPDAACTPGAVLPVTAEQICVKGYSKSVRNVPTSEKKAVYNSYGIFTHSAGQYEVDHLISLELGGSNDIANLWPEAANPHPGFHEKDKVENYLHAQVCAGKISLAEAQRQIATNWMKTYEAEQLADHPVLSDCGSEGCQ